MWPPHQEGLAHLPQCLPTGLFPDRLVLKRGTRAAECEHKEMTGEEQLIALIAFPVAKGLCLPAKSMNVARQLLVVYRGSVSTCAEDN